ncbi:MAG TPA: pyridoxal-phosphate dependent enzyme, partial [Candidatus Dormibacteraeota bacterium]
MGEAVSLEHIAEAAQVIDPVFMHSPQYVCEPLSDQVGVALVLKVECLNPIRSFKGRGTDYFFHRIKSPERGFVCASAGNFGQGMAYAARKRGVRLTVFVADNASVMKIQRMRALGAEVLLEGVDFDAAKEAARAHAESVGAMFVEDGAVAAIAEGAGTIAVELAGMTDALDALLVPLGDGALATGIAAWMRQRSPSTRIIGVVAEGAPAMELSWRAGHVVHTEKVTTIADGIAVRVPVATAVDDVRNSVDDIVKVSDDEMIEGMRWLYRDAGLVVEPAGAAGVAAARQLRAQLSGQLVATIITGGNIGLEQ